MRELAKEPSKRAELPLFSPPKPCLTNGLITVMEVEDSTLQTDKFKKSMRDCFLAVGLTTKDDGTHVKFTSHKHGHLSIIHSMIEI